MVNIIKPAVVNLKISVDEDKKYKIPTTNITSSG